VLPLVGLLRVRHLVGSLTVDVHVVVTLHQVAGGCARCPAKLPWKTSGLNQSKTLLENVRFKPVKKLPWKTSGLNQSKNSPGKTSGLNRLKNLLETSGLNQSKNSPLKHQV